MKKFMRVKFVYAYFISTILLFYGCERDLLKEVSDVNPILKAAGTVGGGTIEDPAIGPAPAFNYGNDIANYVLVKNWDFGTNGNIKNYSDMSAHFYYHDNFNTIANGTKYGAKTVSPDAANALSGQPIEYVNTDGPVREFFSESLKTYLCGLDGATVVNPSTEKAGNGSFMAKWKLPNGGELLGMDLIWETRVRYVTPPYYWFALWTCGNKWNTGAEMDLIESFGYDNGGGYTNFDGDYWHSSVVGGTSETNYHSSWSAGMANYGITNYDATQWHTWTWVYRADDTFSCYVDGINCQNGTLNWTFGATDGGESIDMSFLFDGSWGHTQISSVNKSMNVSEFENKYFEWDYSRVYLRQGKRNLAVEVGAVISYSTQESANPATNLIDGISNDNTNRWSAAGFPNYVEIDLGDVYSISRTDLIGMEERDYQFYVEAKDESGSYQIIVDRTGNTQSGILTDEFNPVNVRYVKLTVTGAYTYTGSYVSLREFKVYGEEATMNPGTSFSIPGTIEAEDYQNYYDTTTGNAGGQYKSDDVDIQACTDNGGGYNVGWITSGEWLEYPIDVTNSGNYLANLRVASNSGGATINLSIDGQSVGSAISVNSTGGWQNWVTVSTNINNLTAGQHMLRVTFTSGGMNLNNINIVENNITPGVLTISDAYASWSEDPNGPANSYDSNYGTRWSTLNNNNIVWDLNSVKSVQEMQIAFYKTRNYYFSIEYSTDANNWTTILANQTSSGANQDLELFSFGTTVSARYVRYVGNGSNVNNYTNILEVEIIGY